MFVARQTFQQVPARGIRWNLCAIAVCLLGWCSVSVSAQDSLVRLADGKITLKPPAAWDAKRPASRIIEYEFSAAAKKDDKTDARITIMGAGGSVEANIERWKGQFKNPAGGAVKADVQQHNVAGQTVHLVDMSGTYNDQRGPFAPGVLREGYRMLAAIIETKSSGRYYVKLYGPQATVAANQDAFKQFIDSMKVE